MGEIKTGTASSIGGSFGISEANKQEIFEGLFNNKPPDQEKVKFSLDQNLVSAQRNLQAVLDEHNISPSTWQDILGQASNDAGIMHSATIENLAKNLAARPAKEIAERLKTMGETAFKSLPKEAQLALIGVVASGVIAFKPEIAKGLAASLAKIKIADSTISLKLGTKEIGVQFTNNKNFSICVYYNPQNNGVRTDVSRGIIAGSLNFADRDTSLFTGFKLNF